MNKLPASWGVLNDGSQLFNETVYKYLIEKSASKEIEYRTGCIYGIEKNTGCIIFRGSHIYFDQILTLDQFIELSKERTVVYGIWSGDMEGGSVDKQLYTDKQKAIDIVKSNVEETNAFWLNHIHAKGTDEEDYQGVIFKQVSETVWTTGDNRIEVQEFELI